ncbi:MAG: hypothetical protein JW791_01605 [Nanoarchaeota archaeon]|nr:hypothetical protein [Nanoarchaeota archaeon]
MKLFYLKQGKDELLIAKELLNNFNEQSAVKLVEHLRKGMDFMIDFINNKHTDLSLEITNIKPLINEFIGKEFFETYYYLNNLSNKSINIMNNSKILIRGKSVDHVNKKLFRDLLNNVINYFNTIYEKAEKGLFWR